MILTVPPTPLPLVKKPDVTPGVPLYPAPAALVPSVVFVVTISAAEPVNISSALKVNTTLVDPPIAGEPTSLLIVMVSPAL